VLFNVIGNKQNCSGNRMCDGFKLILLLDYEGSVEVFETVLEGTCLFPHMLKTFTSSNTHTHKTFVCLDQHVHKNLIIFSLARFIQRHH
jgi:hypothetical protein